MQVAKVPEKEAASMMSSMGWVRREVRRHT
jgi:hypothetical protein